MPLFPPVGRQIRTVGFDDIPFGHKTSRNVQILGAVCADTRFEGLVSGVVRRDGWNATRAIVETLACGKFLPQVHVVLLDGLAFAGFNLIDLPRLAAELQRPCIAVMRRAPDLEAFHRAIGHLSFPAKRRALIERAGPIHRREGFVFQVAGADADAASQALARLTDRGKVPEALRIAHLIGGGITFGESGRRA